MALVAALPDHGETVPPPIRRQDRPRGTHVPSRRGVASRACRAAVRRAFDDAELFRLELGHRVNNPASCEVARTAGFAVEGRQRQKLEYDGVRFDVELHARLATDAGPMSL